jgi:YggT family protein
MNGSRALTYLISTLFDLYIMAIILRLILQWVKADFYNPLSQFVVKITSPLLVPLRRVIPSIGKLATTKLLMAVLWLYFFLILAVVILSWVGSGLRHPIIPLMYQITEPVLRPIRKVIPPIAGFDLSALFAIIAIRFLILLLGY